MAKKISIRLNEGEQIREVLQFMPEEFKQVNEFELAEPLNVAVDGKYEEYGIVITVNVFGELALQCGRCATEFSTTIELKHVIFLIPKAGSWELDEDTEDMNIVDLSQGTLDVFELSRQLVIESIPVKPLCDEACQGLCDLCGKDLNEGECGCQRDTIDPRLAKLKEFIKE